MRKMIRMLSFLLTMLMLLSILAGCGSRATNGNSETNFAGQTQNASDELPDEPTSGELPDEPVPDELPGGFTVEKIGSITADGLNPCSGGLIYRGENRKYGIMTFDGKKVTDAKYASCEEFGSCFLVSMVDKETVTPTDIASMNYLGVVDGNGNEIVPIQYAKVDYLSDRYCCAYEVTEQVDNRYEALLSYGNMLSYITSGDTIFFKGKWQVYDLIAEKRVDGASGTNNNRIFGDDRYISYTTDTGESISVDYNGEKYPANAHSLSSNYYAVEIGNAGTVYNFEHNKKCFSYTLNGFVPLSEDNDYFIGRKSTNGELAFVIMDTTGEVISPEFATCPEIYGDIFYADGSFYNFQGNVIFAGECVEVYDNDEFGGVWIIENGEKYALYGNTYTVINREGTVLYQTSDNDAVHYWPYTLLFCKEIDEKSGSKYMYYSFADEDYTLEGFFPLYYLIQAPGAEDTRDVVDVISGKPIIRGYKEYSVERVYDSVLYVYAQKADGGYDIYTVTKTPTETD